MMLHGFVAIWHISPSISSLSIPLSQLRWPRKEDGGNSVGDGK